MRILMEIISILVIMLYVYGLKNPFNRSSYEQIFESLKQYKISTVSVINNMIFINSLLYMLYMFSLYYELKYPNIYSMILAVAFVIIEGWFYMSRAKIVRDSQTKDELLDNLESFETDWVAQYLNFYQLFTAVMITLMVILQK